MVRHQLLRERNYKTEKNGKKRCLTHKMNANKKINENKQTNKKYMSHLQGHNLYRETDGELFVVIGIVK